MRKYVFIFAAVLWIAPASTFAQGSSSPVDVVQSIQPITPEYYGNGVVKYLIEADNLLRRGRFEEAIIAYDNALVLDPYFAEAYIKRATAKFRLGRTNEAHRDYRQALRLNPYAADLHGYKGSFSRVRVMAFDQITEDNDLDEAIENTPSDWLQDQDYHLLLEQVTKLKNSGSIPAALHAVTQAIDRNNDQDPRLFKLRGNLYVLLDDFRRAILDYDHAILLDNGYEEAYFNRGLANLLTNNRPDACSDLEKSIQLGYQAGRDKLMYFCGH